MAYNKFKLNLAQIYCSINCIGHFVSKHRRYSIANLRKLPRHWSSKDIIIREGLKPSAFTNGHRARNEWMQMGSSPAPSASSNNRFRRQVWIQSINTPHFITLSKTQNHITLNRFGLMISIDIAFSDYWLFEYTSSWNMASFLFWKSKLSDSTSND